MLTYEELDRDPWSTYPVSKSELHTFLMYRELYFERLFADTLVLKIDEVFENADGSMDIKMVVGSSHFKHLLAEGLVSLLKKNVNKVLGEEAEK